MTCSLTSMARDCIGNKRKNSLSASRQRRQKGNAKLAHQDHGLLVLVDKHGQRLDGPVAGLEDAVELGAVTEGVAHLHGLSGAGVSRGSAGRAGAAAACRAGLGGGGLRGARGGRKVALLRTVASEARQRALHWGSAFW